MAFKKRTQPTSEAEVTPIDTDAERNRDLLRKARIITRQLISNQGAVTDGDPSKHYIWVNRHPSRINWFLGLSYKVCKTVILSDEDAAIASASKLDKARREAEIYASRQGMSSSATDKFISNELSKVIPVVKWPTTNWEAEDGTHVRGDLILMEIDKDMHEALQMQAQLTADELLQAPQQEFKDFAEGQGAPVSGKLTYA